MLRIIKYLKPYTWLIIFAVVLLYGQVMTELALPDYLSRIVNIGIQQNGVQSPVPVAIREKEMNNLRLFMDNKDDAFVKDSYILLNKETLSEEYYSAYVDSYPALAEGPVYKLNTDDKIKIEKLSAVMIRPLMILYKIQKKNIQELTGGTDVFPQDISGTLDYLTGLSAEDRGDIVNLVKRNISQIPEGTILQSAISYTASEYKEIGMNLSENQNSYILRIGSIMVILAFLGAMASIVVGYLSARVSAGFARDIRRTLFVKIENFSNIEFDKLTTASLITRTTNDIQQIQFVLMMMIRAVFFSPIMGIGAIIKASSEDVSMLWLIAAALGFMLLLIFTQFTLAIPKFKMMQKLVDKLNMVTRQILTGLMVIRAFNTQKHEEKRFDKSNEEITKTNLFINYVMVIMMPGMTIIMNGIMLAIIWFGAKQIDMGQMQVGNMMAFMQYAMQVIMSFMMVSMTFMMLPRANVSAERIAEVLETESSIQDPDKPEKFAQDFKGMIEFRDVSFKYPDADDYVLKDISFTAKPGETTAFIGSTGSGKSTLINLILRFYDVTEGSIQIDNTDIRTVTQHDLRDKIGYIPQKTVLFSGTVESNIKYADEDMSEEDMRKSAEIAQALEFILNNKNAFQMEIAQAGLNLSGGQKQRLSIARAMAKKPEIFIFDDSFSALDFKTDAELRKALKNETGGSTILIVAQRISTIMNAEQIVVLDEGIVAGIGTHHELMQSCEPYRELALSQLSKEELA